MPSPSVIPLGRYPTKAEMSRVIAAAKEAGLPIGGIEVKPDGTIRVLRKNASAIDGDMEAYFGNAG